MTSPFCRSLGASRIHSSFARIVSSGDSSQHDAPEIDPRRRRARRIASAGLLPFTRKST